MKLSYGLKEVLMRYATQREIMDRALQMAEPRQHDVFAEEAPATIDPGTRAAALKALSFAIDEPVADILFVPTRDASGAAIRRGDLVIDPQKKLMRIIADKYGGEARGLSEPIRTKVWEGLGEALGLDRTTSPDQLDPDFHVRAARRAVLFYFLCNAVTARLSALRKLAPLVQVMDKIVPVAAIERRRVWIAHPA